MKKKRNMKAEKKITDLLLDHAGEKLYLSQVAKMSGVSLSTSHLVLKRKTKEGIIDQEKLGNLSFYSLNINDSLNKQRKIIRTIELLKPLVKKFKPLVQRIIVFGSAAEGINTFKSDIDLFVLTNNQKEVKKIIKKNRLGSKIQPIIKNFLELNILKKKDKIFYEEIKKGKILWEEKNDQ